jgi:predicted cupin superfamily sugar epimerase
MTFTAADYIKILRLKPHPEGGFYRQNYKSLEHISRNALPSRFSSDLSFSTAIYYLLEGQDFGAFHKIKSDEIWHFYAGSPLIIYCIDQLGNTHELELGPDIVNGQQLQIIIKAGHWFAARVQEADSFTLCGCTVAPGFEFHDFTLANREELLKMFPQHEKKIVALTR